MEAKLPALEDLIADVKGTLDDTLSNFQELIHNGIRDKHVAVQQHIHDCVDEKISAAVQKIELLKGENARLPKHFALREAPDLSKTSLILAVTALQSKVASLQLKLSTAHNTEATARKAETQDSRPVPAVSYAENTANKTEHTPVPCTIPRALTIEINPTGLARELDTATLYKARLNSQLTGLRCIKPRGLKTGLLARCRLQLSMKL